MYRVNSWIRNTHSLLALVCLFVCLWKSVVTLAQKIVAQEPGFIAHDCLIVRVLRVLLFFRLSSREKNGKRRFEILRGFAACYTGYGSVAWISPSSFARYNKPECLCKWRRRLKFRLYIDQGKTVVWGEFPRRRQNSSLRGLQQFLLSLRGRLGRSKCVKWRGARRKGCISGLTE